MTDIQRLLIANRGEIACRIMRTAQALGITCIAIYSEPDQDNPFVQQADESYALEGVEATDTYLNIEKIMSIAMATKVDAIHPGYGFLSENAKFASACATKNIIFIGPSVENLEQMGSKDTAKRIMLAANVPCLPGYQDTDQDPQTLANAANDIGFPILLKAAAGGGGKGMRIVREANEFAAALAGAKREALASFADDTMIIEKYLQDPRHIEVQLFADQHGNVVHCFERDCSLQRRQQKILEEAPAPQLHDDLRAALANAAVQAAKAINYRGAGTIEFLLDDAGNFYFMEMNTRLQVEHPVTEMITGVDCVKWQIAIANGKELPAQEDIVTNGHAVEVRLYAEDCQQGFLPMAGLISHCQLPEASAKARIEHALTTGLEVSIHYDPMLAKIIAWGETRAEAVTHLQALLRDTHIAGITTNRDFLIHLLDDENVAKGATHTQYVETHFHYSSTIDATTQHMLAALAYHTLVTPSGWQLNLPARTRVGFLHNNAYYPVTLVQQAEQQWQVSLADAQPTVANVAYHDNKFAVTTNEASYQFAVALTDALITLFTPTATLACNLFIADEFYVNQSLQQGHLTAPMPGKIVAVLVQADDRVEAGQALMILEAMKMEHTICAPAAGSVTAVNFQTGAQVAEGQELIALNLDEQHDGSNT